ncbi:MAG: radical SAM protein [Syntrophomonadaceae bacterium]|nr:radical SAM protein [Dysgonamonadaceae bacterium]MDD3901433.1 radical SAM protein [Dysgonamonadaceae bacterium]MDD4550299.1 radical SAM protein [Syntrophomonadaceae bacterium]
MKNEIILVYPKIDFEDNYPHTWIPYSLLSIAQPIIQEKSAEVIIFDENRRSISDWYLILEEHRENLLCIGFSIMTGGGQIQNALNLASIAKTMDESIITVFGGPHVNVLPIETSEHYLVDIVSIGPGQVSFPLLVKALRNEIKFEHVPGIIAKVDGQKIYGRSNDLKKVAINGYPFGLIDLAQYVQNDPTIASRTIGYITSQGCVYPCRFCYETVYNKKYISLSASNMWDDLIFFIQNHGVNGVKFYDANWFIDLNRAQTICNQIIHSNMDLKWAASIHPFDFYRAKHRGKDLMPLLDKSGCKRLLMGIESGNDRVLSQIVNKKITKSQIREVTKTIADYGILGSYTFIVGFPGENECEQNETFSFIEELWRLSPKPETRVHIYTPYPGTPLYDEALSNGFKPPDSLEKWSDFNYYKSLTPWTNDNLEKKVAEFTSMIPKNN